MALISLRNATIAFGGQPILADISLRIERDERVCLYGRNGEGKSTLLKMLNGEIAPDSGELARANGLRTAYLNQDTPADLAGTVRKIVAGGANNAPGHQIDSALSRLSLDADANFDELSGGLKRRVFLARTIAAEPDVLLLDEPTNHLDAESVAWLERTLKDYHGTVVAITHDRYFLDNVAGWILEMDRGRGIPFEGNYSGWLEQKTARLDAEQKTDSARRRTLERELEWVRMAPKARQSKGKARLTAYDRLVVEAADAERRDRELQIDIPANQRLGDQVVEVEHLAKGFGDKLLIEDLSFSLPPAGIVGVIGGNGAGKTTLFRMLVEASDASGDPTWTPDAGVIRIGPTVEIGYVDQSRDTLDPERTVYEEITDGREFLQVGRREVNGRAYVASFNFKGTDQQKNVGDLSGGERNRVHLAKVLKSGANLLLLDEPTNDLDVDTLRALESGLDAYAGCAAIISHDRWFLDRVATHVLAFEGDSQVRWFEGNFTEYEAYRKKELGLDAQPTRVRYKPLTRG